MNFWIDTSISNSRRWYLLSSFFCSRRPLIADSIMSIWSWFFISINFINCHNIVIHEVPDIVVYLFIADVFILIVLLSKRIFVSKFSISLIRYWWFIFFIYRINILVDKMINIIFNLFITNIFLLSKWFCFWKFSIFLTLDSLRFIKNRRWISFAAVWKSLQIKHIIWKFRNPRIVSLFTKRRWFWLIIKLNRSIELNGFWARE